MKIDLEAAIAAAVEWFPWAYSIDLLVKPWEDHQRGIYAWTVRATDDIGSTVFVYRHEVDISWMERLNSLFQSLEQGLLKQVGDARLHVPPNGPATKIRYDRTRWGRSLDHPLEIAMSRWFHDAESWAVEQDPMLRVWHLGVAYRFRGQRFHFTSEISDDSIEDYGDGESGVAYAMRALHRQVDMARLGVGT